MSTPPQVDIRFVAAQYIAAGWAVVPIIAGQKRADSRWTKKTYGPKDFGPNDNIAGKCGEPSGWLVDIDLDAKEAVEAGKLLLPATGLIHGRPGKPDSHYWYRCEGAKMHVWKDVKDTGGQTGTLLELRSTGGYTVLPPSIHPSGEIITWILERDPLSISADDLMLAGRNVGIAALLARRWPGPGARHHMIGHLAGFLCRYGLDDRFIVKVIEVAALVARDSDVKDRVVYARNTLEKYRNNPKTPLTGGPKLAESLGEDVVGRLKQWLGARDDDALEEMNRRHFVVRLGKDEVIATEEEHDVVFQKRHSLELRYANKKIQVGISKKGEPQLKPVIQAWLEWPGRRDFRSVQFAPPPLACDPRDYNLWKGFAVQPKDGPCPLFLEHLEKIICGGHREHYRYLLKLLAYTVQAPGRPPGVATVMRGEPGTGKGIFVRALARIFGRHACHLSQREHLVGHFNAHLSAKCLVFADEAMWAGDKKEVGELKRLITEPTLTIERKGIDAVQETNCVHLFMATNEHWSAPAQLKERRFFALEVSNARRGDFDYFRRLAEELDNGGLAAFLHALAHVPVTPEEILAVPKTQELRRQQEQSLPAELTWWLEALRDGAVIPSEPWPGVIPCAKLFELYKQFAHDRRARLLAPTEFGRRLGKFVSTDKSYLRKNARAVERVYDVRPLDDARRFFDQELTTNTEWPDVQQTQRPIF